MSENIKTIENAFQIIEHLHDNGKVGVSDIATALGLPKTSAHRILKTLQNLNVVIQDEDEIYALGYSMFKYASGIHQDQTLIDTASPAMSEFSKETGETVNLGILLGDEVLVLHSAIGEFCSLQPTLSQSTPLYCSGMGKVFLSQFEEKKLESYFESDLKERTINSITEKISYDKEKSIFFETKIAYDNEEYEYGLSCISTAIYSNDGKIIAALSVSGPSSRLIHKGYKELEKRLLETSKAITENMK